MKEFGTLYIFELKKILGQRLVLVSLLLGAAMIFGWNLLTFASTGYYYNVYDAGDRTVERQIANYGAVEAMGRDYLRGLSGQLLDDPLMEQLAAEYEGDFRFEYSPESFTGTEPEYALEVCNAVLDIMQPTPEKPMIINLPVTVAMSMSHIYANQIEYMSDNLKYRDSVVLSLHPHNDRGCGVADTELALLAGADRVEGTLFGNGERTGNVDLVTLALNLYSQGVDPGLNFENLPYVSSMYSRLTGMRIPERQPYAGELVFAAFSGSHQDAIAKGLKWREAHPQAAWNVPYLPVDPRDIGREYEKDVIRINSQSGKGGVGYVLESRYALKLPARLKEAFSKVVKRVTDEGHKELQPAEIHELFLDTYLRNRRYFSLSEPHYRQREGIDAEAVLTDGRGETHALSGHGNGRLDAVSNMLKAYLGIPYSLNGYEQHALTEGSSSKAITYLGVAEGEIGCWGVGVHDDSTTSSVLALCAALNNLLALLEGIAR